MLEAVPERILGGRQPVGAGEVDHDAAGGRLEAGGALVVEAAEDHVGAARERLLVGDEVRDRGIAVAGEARVERGRGAAGERVGAECDQLELGVREDAV